MRRKVRKSLIVVVLLVVILGVGFGIYRIFFAPKPPPPLKIKDVENMHIAIPRASRPNGWTIYGIDIESNKILGWVSDNENIFHDKQVPLSSKGIRLAFVRVSEPMAVQAGDTLEIRFDGGQTLIIYLPTITEDVWLYIAPDGSTYYNEALTQLACLSDSVKPLKIKDLEKAYITVPRSSIEKGCEIDIYGTAESIISFGAIYDNQNVCIDFKSSGTAIPIHIWVQESDEGKYMHAGDTLKITYDGGQKLTIYMPEGWGKVYVATDGSTYYDKDLTKLAQKIPISPEEGGR